ncbi:MAG TPA: hypothetical protein DEA08_26855 [Planctomycetes bacterium]|nr:hypothetical protein [Planctomycetota bacterium]|tara:strand:+ start:17 stop:367 length:351 start_codon:yes stop_codon:yes gene_type:complete
MSKVRVVSRPSLARCPYCHDSAAIVEAGRRCGGCGTRYHVECANELGGRCATLGCERVLGLGVEPGQRLKQPVRRQVESPRSESPRSEPVTPSGFCGLWLVLELVGAIGSLLSLFL